MRLSLVLWRKKMPNGHIYRGKHRLYPKVTPLMVAEDRLKLEIEERNMYLLRHPYLTVEQEKGHALELGKKQNWLLQKIMSKEITLKPHVVIEERLNHLRVTEAWD